MTAIPEDLWTSEAKKVKQNAVEFALLHRLIWSNHNSDIPVTQKNTRPIRLTAPLSYYHDAVEIATTLLKLGVKSPAIDEAIDYVIAKRTLNMRWIAENTINPISAPFAKKGKESKWVTYRVLRMLMLAGRLRIYNAITPIPSRSSIFVP